MLSVVYFVCSPNVLANPRLYLARGRFLLKYASRDEVELLGRGNGGIVEIRNAIAVFEPVEPLFGFLRYRRRNVIIKHLPEACSRLVQGMVISSLSHRVLRGRGKHEDEREGR